MLLLAIMYFQGTERSTETWNVHRLAVKSSTRYSANPNSNFSEKKQHISDKLSRYAASRRRCKSDANNSTPDEPQTNFGFLNSADLHMGLDL